MTGNSRILVQSRDDENRDKLDWLDRELASSVWMGRTGFAAPVGGAPLEGDRPELWWALGGAAMGVLGYCVAALF